MARVYEARRESLHGVAPRVAIKVIRPEHAQNERFQRMFINEARIGSLLQHPNVVQIQDFDREDDVFYLVMEFVEGVTMRRAISLCRRHAIQLPMAVVAEVGRQVCEGLHYAHTATDEDGTALGLVHRDVKPSNLILNPQGVVKILDFGVAKAHGSRRGRGVKGTWGYMSPEQADNGDVAGAADQYALASVLYELATLDALLPGRQAEQIRLWMREDLPARKAAALGGPYRQLGPVLVRALQRDPAARYPTAKALAAALAARIDDPVRVRDQLAQLQETLARLQDAPESQLPGSRGTHSAGRTQSTHPPTAGLPLSVGTSLQPRILEEPEFTTSPGKVRPRSAPWVARALAAAGVAVLGFTAITLWQGGQFDGLFGSSAPAEGVTASARSGTGPVAEEPLVTEQAVTEQAVTGQAVTEQALTEQALTEQAVTEQAETEQAVAEPEVEELPPPSSPLPPPTTPKPRPAATSPTRSSTAPPVAVPVPAAPEVAAEPGLVTISSLPRASVTVDGRYLRHTPLFRERLPAGPHQVVLESEDGRRFQFTLEVPAGTEIRKVWDFNEGRWVE